VAGKYHLITLQGVSEQSKQRIIEKLNPYYPYFIRSENSRQQVYSDQLLFSLYAFSKIRYYRYNDISYLVSSQWQSPFGDINLYTLHPPSPRNEKLWQIRNKTLYQLKYAIESLSQKSSSMKSSIVIGDLNISKNSSRIKLLTQGMNTEFVNSWPKIGYVLPYFGLAIDHFFVSKAATICNRQRINQFSWSDHYAIKTRVYFKSR
jgi:endonuclease/exonuclease/phosphatase (EEP) superfamily protein YafD